MPAKDKKKKKPKKPKKNQDVEEVVEKTEFDDMALEQLQQEFKMLSEKVEDCVMKRNYFQQERDQIQQFYDIVHQDVLETQAKIRNTEAEMERMQDAHRKDIRVYVAQVKFLENDNEKTLGVLNQEGITLQQQETNAHLDRKTSLQDKKEELKNELKKVELANQEEIRRLKEFMQKELAQLRHQYTQTTDKLQNTYQQRLQDLKEDLELRRRMEIHEIEERKNLHINMLMRNHEQSFKEIRNYYNTITRDNLDYIKSLHDDCTRYKQQAVRNAKRKDELKNENSKLAKPLAEAKEDVKGLKEKLLNYEKVKLSLRQSKARLLVVDEQSRNLTQEHEALQKRFHQVAMERDQLLATFEETVKSIEDKGQRRNEVLEKKAEEFQEKYHRKHAQFVEVLRAANLDEVVLRNVTEKLDQVLSAKNQQLRAVRQELARVRKATDDLIRMYEAKLVEFGIPEQHRGLMMPLSGLSTAPISLAT